MWSSNQIVNPLPYLYNEYSKAKGNNWAFLLNVGPDKSGRIPAADITALMDLKKMISQGSNQ